MRDSSFSFKLYIPIKSSFEKLSWFINSILLIIAWIDSGAYSIENDIKIATNANNTVIGITRVIETPSISDNADIIDSADENAETEATLAEPELATPEQATPQASKSVRIAEPIQETIELETSVADEDVVKSTEEVQAVAEDKNEVVLESEASALASTEPVTKEESLDKPVAKTKVKKVTAKVAKKTPSKSPNKDKKLARQVKKANRLSGHAASPMTKTATITTINEIPTSFMASEDRMAHQVSGRTAVAADAISRSSAATTKPV